VLPPFQLYVGSYTPFSIEYRIDIWYIYIYIFCILHPFFFAKFAKYGAPPTVKIWHRLRWSARPRLQCRKPHRALRPVPSLTSCPESFSGPAEFVHVCRWFFSRKWLDFSAAKCQESRFSPWKTHVFWKRTQMIHWSKSWGSIQWFNNDRNFKQWYRDSIHKNSGLH